MCTTKYQLDGPSADVRGRLKRMRSGIAFRLNRLDIDKMAGSSLAITERYLYSVQATLDKLVAMEDS